MPIGTLYYVGFIIHMVIRDVSLVSASCDKTSLANKVKATKKKEKYIARFAHTRRPGKFLLKLQARTHHTFLGGLFSFLKRVVALGISTCTATRHTPDPHQTQPVGTNLHVQSDL